MYEVMAAAKADWKLGCDVIAPAISSVRGDWLGATWDGSLFSSLVKYGGFNDASSFGSCLARLSGGAVSPYRLV